MIDCRRLVTGERKVVSNTRVMVEPTADDRYETGFVDDTVRDCVIECRDPSSCDARLEEVGEDAVSE